MRGNKKFLFSSSKDRIKQPISREGRLGTPSSIEQGEALDKARKFLEDGKKILLVGGTKLSNEAQLAFLNLAANFNADVYFHGTGTYKILKQQFSSIPLNYFSIGEVINNSDTIIFLGANPIDNAPKLVVKSIFSRGRYRQSGKEVKKFIVMDDYPTPTMERADVKIVTEPGQHGKTLEALVSELVKQGILSGEDAESLGVSILDPKEPKNATIVDLAAILGLSEYTTTFVGESILNKGAMESEPEFLPKFLSLSARLNGKNNTCALPLFYPFNFMGMAQALSTTPEPINLKNWVDVKEKLGEYDVILSAGFDFIGMLDDESLAKIKEARIINLDYKQNPTTEIADLTLPVLITGIESGETATRLDGCVMKLSPCIEGKEGMLPDVEILKLLI